MPSARSVKSTASSSACHCRWRTRCAADRRSSDCSMLVRSLEARAHHSSAFQRFVLPGLAFKAVVIGGGYATGREIAEFFLPAGPWGGVGAQGGRSPARGVGCGGGVV